MDEREYSPELQRKLAETATRSKSFVSAAELARIWSGVAISSRQLGRVVEALGAELVAQRDAEVDAFTHHHRQAEGRDPHHELAVVFVDGGRVQIRDETWGVEPEPGEKKGKFWREDKVARIQTMTAVCHREDPCPEPPRCFLDAAKLESLSAPAEPRDAPKKDGESAGALAPPPPAEPAERWTPEPLVRTCVATMRGIEDFRWMVQAEAKRRHFFTAEKRAFVADGAPDNWTTLHAKHFADFVPILDFLHVAGYLHAAARALGSVTLGCPWIRDVWQGRAATVAGELARRLSEAAGADDVPKEHPLRPVRDAAHYLTAHADKVDDPRYRRDGLPCTSSLIESQIKEFHARVKGTEKFWNGENAEAMLQLIAWTLRDDGPTLRDHLESRPGHAFRRRTTRAEPKTTAA